MGLEHVLHADPGIVQETVGPLLQGAAGEQIRQALARLVLPGLAHGQQPLPQAPVGQVRTLELAPGPGSVLVQFQGRKLAQDPPGLRPRGRLPLFFLLRQPLHPNLLGIGPDLLPGRPRGPGLLCGRSRLPSLLRQRGLAARPLRTTRPRGRSRPALQRGLGLLRLLALLGPLDTPGIAGRLPHRLKAGGLVAGALVRLADTGLDCHRNRPAACLPVLRQALQRLRQDVARQIPHLHAVADQKAVVGHQAGNVVAPRALIPAQQLVAGGQPQRSRHPAEDA